jgi:hypothetical chaperone protein
MGSRYRSPFGSKLLDIPASIFKLRWHELSTLSAPQTLRDIEAYMADALEPEKLEAFAHLVECDLGYALYQAVEGTKVALSAQPEATFVFQDGPIDIRTQVSREDFSGWIGRELQILGDCVDGLLTQTGVEPPQVDRVFMTGGSSFIPAVRQLFVDRFGASKIRAGEELTSVATGLAVRAAQEGARG